MQIFTIFLRSVRESSGSRFVLLLKKIGHFLAHVIFLLYLCTRKGFSVLSQSMEELLLLNLNDPFFAATFWGISAHIAVGD